MCRLRRHNGKFESIWKERDGDRGMEEKTYRAMSFGGTAGIVAGVISIIIGVACGVVMIVAGARLLAERRNILF